MVSNSFLDRIDSESDLERQQFIRRALSFVAEYDSTINDRLQEVYAGDNGMGLGHKIYFFSDQYNQRTNDQEHLDQFQNDIIALIKEIHPTLQFDTGADFFKFVIKLLEDHLKELRAEEDDEEMDHVTNEDGTSYNLNEATRTYTTFFAEAKKLFNLPDEKLLQEQNRTLPELPRKKWDQLH